MDNKYSVPQGTLNVNKSSINLQDDYDNINVTYIGENLKYFIL